MAYIHRLLLAALQCFGLILCMIAGILVWNKAGLVRPKILWNASKVKLFDTFYISVECFFAPGMVVAKAAETIAELRRQGKKLFFLTNDSTKSRSSLRNELQESGIRTRLSEMFPSSYLAALYLEKTLHIPIDSKVLVLGGEGLIQELKDVGYETIEGSDVLPNHETCNDKLASMKLDTAIKSVVIGKSSRFSQDIATYIFRCAQELKAAVVLTHADPFALAGRSKVLIPDMGCAGYFNHVFAPLGITVHVCGPPEPFLFRITEKDTTGRSLVVGNSFARDVKFATKAGISSLFVKPDHERSLGMQCNGTRKILRPDYVTRSFANILK